MLLPLLLAAAGAQDPVVSIPADAPIRPAFRLLLDDGSGALRDLNWTIAPPTRSSPATPTATPGVTSAAQAGPLLVAELGLDTDYEFFVAEGSDVNQATNKLLEVVATLNVPFESQLGIRHEVSTLVIRSSPLDPYTGNVIAGHLNQVQVEWNTSLAAEPRDLVQLASGKDFLGGTLNLAFSNGVCDTFGGFSVVDYDFELSQACIAGLARNALTRNWGGTFPQEFDCDNNSFSAATVAEILAFAAGLTCLDSVQPGLLNMVNGSGLNPQALSGFAPPLTGNTWFASIEAAGTTFTSFALFADSLAPLTTSLGELLVNPATQVLFETLPTAGENTLFPLEIPANPALVGLTLHAQGLLDVSQLTNSLELVIGG